MGTRIIPIVLSVLLFVHCKPEQKEYVINPAEFIYGQWRCKKYTWRRFVKLTDEQVSNIQASTLHIEKDKIYLKGIDFIEPHSFSEKDIKISKFNDDDIKSVYHIKGAFYYHFTKDQIKNFDRIELGTKQYGLRVLYLDTDVLILDHYCGYAFFMEKIPTIEKHYQGKESSIQTLAIVKACAFAKITYSVKGAPAQLLVKDQVGKTLFRILLEENEQTKTIRVPLCKVTELTFEVCSSHPHFEWNLATLVY